MDASSGLFNYVCQQHGIVAVYSVYEDATRRTVICPDCGKLAELWLGSDRQRGDMMLSSRARRRRRR